MTPERLAEIRKKHDRMAQLNPGTHHERDYHDMLEEIDRLREALGKITFHQYLGLGLITSKPHDPLCPGCIAEDALGKGS